MGLVKMLLINSLSIRAFFAGIVMTTCVIHAEQTIASTNTPLKNKVYVNTCGLPFVVCLEGGVERQIGETNNRPLVLGLFSITGGGSYSINNADTSNPEIVKLDLQAAYLISGFRFLIYEAINFSGWYGGLVIAMSWHETALSKNNPCKECTLVDAGRIQRYFRPTMGLEGGYAFNGDKWVFTIGLRLLFAEKDSVNYSVSKGGQIISATTDIKTNSYPFFGTVIISVGYEF